MRPEGFGSVRPLWWSRAERDRQANEGISGAAEAGLGVGVLGLGRQAAELGDEPVGPGLPLGDRGVRPGTRGWGRAERRTEGVLHEMSSRVVKSAENIRRSTPFSAKNFEPVDNRPTQPAPGQRAPVPVGHFHK